MKYKLYKQFRCKEYDYSEQGFYFITICAQDRKNYFGKIIDKKMEYSEIGKIVELFWKEIPKHFNNVELDEFIVMPNHIHGIIQIARRNEAMPRSYTGKYAHMSKISPKQNSISVIIGSYKSIVSKNTNQKFPQINFSWQSRFYDRIIRDEKELNNIRQYIILNPENWEKDEENTKNFIKNNRKGLPPNALS